MKNRDLQKKAVMFWLLLLITLILTSIVVRLIKTFRQTNALLFDRYAVAMFFTDSGQTGLFIKNNDQANLVVIPSDTKIAVTRGYGEYQLDKVYALGQLSGHGGQLLLESLAEYLNFPILGLVVSNAQIDINQKWLGKRQLADIFNRGNWVFYDGNTYSQKIGFKYRFWQLKQREFKLVDYSQVAEGGVDLTISQDNLSLEVINLTKINGMAERFATKLETNGFRVIRTAGDTTKDNFICRILTRPDHLADYSYLWLLHFRRCMYGGLLLDNSRVDIRIEIGTGYQQILEEKW